MKTSFRILTAVMAILMLLTALSGCTDNPTTETESTGTVTDPANDKPTLKVNGVPLSEYTIVRSKVIINRGSETVNYFNNKTTEDYGVTLSAETTSSEDRYEILIGTDGGNTEAADAYKQNQNGVIGANGKKIYLLGRNYGALCQVIDCFFAKASGSGTAKEISLSGFSNADIKVTSIKVLSYNVQRDLAKEGREKNAREEMVATILEADPDVFGTQEDTSTINSYFTEHLPAYSCYQAEGDAGNYVYWKTDKFTAIKKGYFYMSDTPGAKSRYEESNEYRTFSFVLLESKETGEQFFFLDVHTDYRGSMNDPSGGADIARKKQLQSLTKQLSKINKTFLPTVILGDFNATPSASSIETFKKENNTIAMTSEVALTKGDKGGTLAVSMFTTRQSYVFDYVFVSKDSIVTQYYSAINNVKDGKYPSDHLPVVATLDLY